MKDKKRKYNTYEKEILLPLKISKIILVVYVLLNLLFPTYSDGSKGFQHVYAYVSSILVFLGVLGIHGRLSQIVPLLPMILVRLIQFVIGYVYKSPMIISVFIIFLLTDIGVNIFFMSDRALYEQIEESEE